MYVFVHRWIATWILEHQLLICGIACIKTEQGIEPDAAGL